MKKSITLLALSLLLGTGVFAEDTYLITDLTLDNFWAKTGKAQEKVSYVAQNLIVRNQFAKRTPVIVTSNKEVNAVTNSFSRQIAVYSGVLTCIDNDDELAYLLGHEMAHAMETYKGLMSVMTYRFNPKPYETNADLRAVDYMVKAGYDPIAGIIFINKTSPEPIWDWGFTHPKGSKRMLAMYKYIYKKYPQYLTSSKTNSPYYKNFEYMFEDELKGFRHKESVRKQKQLQREAI